MTVLEPGLAASVSHVVTAADTAVALESGDVAVLATPRLVAWMEAATVAAVGGVLPAGDTTVGTRVEIDHVNACGVGTTVRVDAELVSVERRTLDFDAVAVDGSGRRLGQGRITRAVVERERFLSRV